MERKVIFKNETKTEEITLPITPESYQMQRGMKIETVNIHALGDVSLAGYTTLASITVEAVLPSRKRPEMVPGARANPQYYIDKFWECTTNRHKLRYIVSGTKSNLPVYLENLEYREDDGTNDIKVTLTLRERKELKKLRTTTVKKNKPRAAPVKKSTVRSYKVVRGDTLWGICNRFYKKPTLCYKLAKYNGIKNANLIYAGQVIKIPEASKL